MLFREQGFDNLDFSIQSSIVAENIGSSAALGADIGASGNLSITGSNNLIFDAGQLVLPSDTLSADPLLAALADNGGPTRTHALLSDSPALDAGNNSSNLMYDQRGEGFLRAVGSGVDMGAIEWQGEVIDLIFRNGFDEPVAFVYR